MGRWEVLPSGIAVPAPLERPTQARPVHPALAEHIREAEYQPSQGTLDEWGKRARVLEMRERRVRDEERQRALTEQWVREGRTPTRIPDPPPPPPPKPAPKPEPDLRRPAQKGEGWSVLPAGPDLWTTTREDAAKWNLRRRAPGYEEPPRDHWGEIVDERFTASTRQEQARERTPRERSPNI